MIFSIILLIILILINGIFSASEIAFLSLDKVKLKQEAGKGDTHAKNIIKVLEDSSAFLSTIQIAITLAGFLASAFAADYFAEFFMGVINPDPASAALVETLLIILITIVLSYFTLVFGELVPKKIGINKSYGVAKRTVHLIMVVKTIFYPLIRLLTLSTNLVCKLFNIKDNKDDLTEEDIKKMILLGKDEGVIEEKEKDYILNVFEFNDVDAEKVMTPREKISMINIDDDLRNIMSIIREAQYSRFPVYRGDPNNIIGILNVKDLIIQHFEDGNIKIENILRKTSRFNHNDKIDDVFRLMQERNESLSIIYKSEQMIGLVTIEDAVEEIVGNIYDEYDDAEDKAEA